MNKILNIAIVLVVLLSMASCKKESEGVSSITTYANMELKGASTLYWQLNQPFVDPGSTAKEGETDLTSSIAVNSNVDVSKGGFYTMTYSVNNSDGFPASINRTVIVLDKIAPLNGYYESRIFRDNAGATGNRGPFTVMIFGVGNNQYYVQDLLGRWYDVGNNYGAAYAGSGIIKLNSDNTFTRISSQNLLFSGSSAPVFTKSTTSTYDPATKTIVLNTNMGDVPTMLFKVTLTNPSPINY